MPDTTKATAVAVARAEARHSALVAAYLTTGSVSAAAKAAGYTRQHASQVLNHPSHALYNRFWQAVEATDMTLTESMRALQAAHAADVTIVTPTGQVITGLPDHKTRVMAARTFLSLVVTMEKLGEPAPPPPPAPPTRPLTVHELMQVSPDMLNRVVMESTRVLVEPMDSAPDDEERRT